ncbi:MAG: HEAT repeat domain-containing protein, partial [Nitrospinales bacterium]
MNFGKTLLFLITIGLASSTGYAQLNDHPSTRTVLEKIRQQCISILEKAYENENSFIRGAAIRAAGESADPLMLPLLEKGVEDFYATNRLFALQALQKMAPVKAFALANKLIDDPDLWVKIAALKVIGDAEKEESKNLIRPKLDSADL